MNDTQHSRRKSVSHLIQDLEDGSITPEDRAVLMQLMRDHESVRSLYLRHVELATLLHQVAESRVELGTMPISVETLRREKRRSVVFSLLYAAAAVLVAGVGLFLFQAQERRQGEVDQAIALESSIDADYAVVRPEEASGPGDQLEPGDQINLTRGLVRLTFPSGVEALVEGPTQLELIANSTLRMDHGMGWFRVPEAGHGFTVRTEIGQVIDLGTEFGVRFDSGGDLEVHVADGRVKVVPAVPGAGSRELVAGQAMGFGPTGEGRSIDLRTRGFRQEFSRELPHVHWSFDRLEDGVFPARGVSSEVKDHAFLPSRVDGEPVDEESCLTDGFHGRAFSLTGDGVFAASAFPGLDGDAPYTVAAWIRPREPSFRVGEDSADPRTGFGVTTPFGEQAYLLFYTNAALTTSQGSIKQPLVAGETYQVTFRTAALTEGSETGYLVELVAFESDDDDEARLPARGGMLAGTVLARAEGVVSSRDHSKRGEFSFTPDDTETALGKEIGIRLLKRNEPVTYDQVELRIGAPDGVSEILLSESFESPVVVGYAEEVLPSKRWVGATKSTHAYASRLPYGSRRHGLFNQRPVYSKPYLVSDTMPGGWMAFLLPTSSPRWSILGGQGFVDAKPTKEIRRNEWNHVAVVHTGNMARDGKREILFFLDGEPVEVEWPEVEADRIRPVDFSSDLPLLIGALPGAGPGSPTLDADIDELHLIRGVLNEQEIWGLMDENRVSLRK